MTSHASLIVNVGPPQGLTATIPIDAPWLRLELVEAEGEKISSGEAAELVDTLYEVEPCVEVTGNVEEPEQPTPAQLKDAAQAVLYDAAMCDQMLSGEYSRSVKVIRGDASIPYRLRLSLGTTGIPTTVKERMEEALNIDNASYIVLPYPLDTDPDFFRCAASWLGSVSTEEGRITPPTINRVGNTLFWGFAVSGTLMVHWNTEYDVVRVTIPGITAEGRTFGESQTSSLMAFYNRTVTTILVDPPERAEDEDLSWLSFICGWTDVDGGGSSVEDEEEEDDDDTPGMITQQEGCYARDGRFPLQSFSEEICCEWIRRGDCQEYRIPKPFAHLSQSRRDEIVEAVSDGGAFGGFWSGGFQYDIRDVEFRVRNPAPDDPSNCGWNIYQVRANRRACCDGVPPLIYDTENSVEVINDFSWGIVYTSEGRPPYTWTVRGRGFYTDQALRERGKVTDNPYLIIYTADSCGVCLVSVTDGCSFATGQVVSAVGSWGPWYRLCGGNCGWSNSPANFRYEYFPAYQLRLMQVQESYVQYCNDPKCNEIMPECTWGGSGIWPIVINYDCILGTKERRDWIC